MAGNVWSELKKTLKNQSNSVWDSLGLDDEPVPPPIVDYSPIIVDNEFPVGTIAFDLETGSVKEMWTCGQEFVRLSGHCIDGGPIRNYPSPAVLIDDLLDHDGWVIAHNGMNFDSVLLDRLYGVSILHLAKRDRLVDTKLLAFLADPPGSRMTQGEIEKRYSLQTVGTKYLGEGKMVDVLTGGSVLKELAKTYGGFDQIPQDDAQYNEYLKRDVEATRDLAKVLPMSDYTRREHKLAAVCATISIQGFRVDVRLLEERIKEGEDKRARILGELSSYGLPSPESTKAPQRTTAGIQAINTAFVNLGITLPRSEKTNRPMMGKDVLQGVIDSGTSEEAADLAEAIQSLNGIRTIYGNIQDNLVGDRVHPNINLRQSTGRLSITEPGLTVIGKRGGKVKERAVFLPDEGTVLISADLAQVDARAVAGLSQDTEYLKLFENGRDLHAEMAERLFRDPAKRELAKAACVPLDTEILTRTGWKTWDQVEVGTDQTLGLGDDGDLHWTPVLAVNRYDDAEVIRLKTRRFDVVCTPNHGWISDWRRGFNDGRPKYYERVSKEAQNLGSDDNLVLSAVAQTGKGLDITNDEAELFGWILGDGSLRWTALGGRSQGVNGDRRSVLVTIDQAKPHWVDHLRILTRGWTVSGPTFCSGFGGTLGKYHFNMPSVQARDLIRRCGFLLPNTAGTKLDLDLDRFVLELSSEQRDAFLNGFWGAEGHMFGTNRIITQAKGILLDAVQLAVFLKGHIAHRQDHSTESCQRLLWSSPRVTGQKLKKTVAGRTDVWCPTTGLGTWVMRQNGQVFLSRNSHGINYGMRAKKLSFTTGMDLYEAETVILNFEKSFPVLARWQNKVREEGQTTGILYNGWGRLMRIEPERAFTQSPALMGQSTARDILMEGILRLWDKGGEEVIRMIRGIIHDELVMAVPVDDVDEIERLVVDAMSFPWCPVGGTYEVQILAGLNQRGTDWAACYGK